MFAYFATERNILLVGWLAMFAAYMAWRFTPTRGASCPLPATPRQEHPEKATH